ncbi:ECF-type sigma factor [Povalibacter sp.]|uniref:ECF-type sigma factor n=1 Tax=Povalibacter sp. TaxID=1962978 RepID=UPI002F3F0B43
MLQGTSITDLIQRADAGDSSALLSVFATCYDDLRRLAQHRLACNSPDTLLDATTLVHESYLRLASARAPHIVDRQHFLRYVGHIMRSVIVDFVRERLTQRRGGKALHVAFNGQIDESDMADEAQVRRLRDALQDLAKDCPRMRQVIELRYFAGLTEGEIARVLGVTGRTVRRYGEKARQVLAGMLASNDCRMM